MTVELYKAVSSECLKICPEARVYRNNIPQGFKAPCFLVIMTDTQAQRKLFNSLQITHSIDVSYFSEVGKEERLFECEKMKEEMMRAFDVIGSDGLSFYVTGKNANVTDDVLHFMFNVSCTEKPVTEEPVIEEINTNIKEE